MKAVGSALRDMKGYCIDRCATVVSLLRDWRYGIYVGRKAAHDPEDQSSSAHKDMCAYDTINYGTLERIMRFLAPSPDDVFVDLGCGRGRVICYAATYAMKRVIGVELDHALLRAARRNSRRVRGTRTPITVVHQDAATFDFSEVTVVFLFNPFGEKTLQQVVASLKQSCAHNPRRLRIVYHTPRHRGMLDSQTWLTPLTHACKGDWQVWQTC